MATNKKMANVMRIWALTGVVSLYALPLSGEARAQERASGRTELTVWLMPNEPAAASVGGHQTIKGEVDRFNEEMEKQSVTVVNTTDSHLREQLLAWNPEYAVPNWPIVKGQRRTLEALGKFAQLQQVQVKILFVNWSRAFTDIQNTLAKPGHHRYPPDVAQVGSTWVAFYAAAKLLLQPSGEQKEKAQWRSGPDGAGEASLRYLQDVRLIYYWRRLPGDPLTTPEFRLDSRDWPSIIRSLQGPGPSLQAKSHRPPMVLPIGYGYGSTNLLHDYVPLVWSGGAPFIEEEATRVDLTSFQALKIPLLISKEATQWDKNGLEYRILAFPEMAHQEAISHFVEGRYLAMIEPVGFLPNWSKDFQHRFKDKPTSSFWDYAGVAVPPCTFNGGSDLIVAHNTENPGLAFEVARFLASDPSCLQMLASLGHLPAQQKGRGIDVMLKLLGGDEHSLQEVAAVISRAVESEGREYPQLPNWATDVESREVIEGMQRLWRRIGEGGRGADAEARIREAAEQVELAINLRSDRATQIRHFLARYWPFIIVGILVLVIGLLAKHWFSARRRFEEEHEKNRLLEEVRRLRGFTSNSLSGLFEKHLSFWKNPDNVSADGPSDCQPPAVKEKARIIRAELLGLRRGIDATLWKECRLEQVVWNAVILAMDPSGGLFKEWEQTGYQPAREFLESLGLVRESPGLYEGCQPFYFKVSGAEKRIVHTPPMLEHALVCLLQNAIKASEDETAEHCRRYHAISINYDPVSDTVSIQNSGRAISPVLRKVLNESRDIQEFARDVDRLLDGAIEDRPGIGLVAAYCITKQCYGGMTVEATMSKVLVSVRLRVPPEEPKR